MIFHPFTTHRNSDVEMYDPDPDRTYPVFLVN